jgi:hypothetical protein
MATTTTKFAVVELNEVYYFPIDNDIDCKKVLDMFYSLTLLAAHHHPFDYWVDFTMANCPEVVNMQEVQLFDLHENTLLAVAGMGGGGNIRIIDRMYLDRIDEVKKSALYKTLNDRQIEESIHLRADFLNYIIDGKKKYLIN